MRFSLIFFLFVSCCTGIALAQGAPGSSRLAVPIDFEVVNGDFTNAMVYMRREGETVATFKGAHTMKVKLEYNAEYRLDFTKPGYITKSIRINTGTPEDRRKIGYDPYKIGVRLFKQYEGVNIVVYNQPVAYIRYLPEMDEFGYDTDYTKSILSELRIAEEALEKKAAEERRLEKLAAAKKKEVRKLPADTRVEPVKVSETKSAVPANETLAATTPSIVNESQEAKAAVIASAGEAEKQVTQGGFGAGGEDPKTSGATSAGDQPVGGSNGTNGEDVPKTGLNTDAGADARPLKVTAPPMEERRMEVVREKNRTITYFYVKSGDELHTFKMVQYDWGGLYYFVNETRNVTQHDFNVLTHPASR